MLKLSIFAKTRADTTIALKSMKKTLSTVLILLAGISAFGQNSKVENSGKAHVSSIYDMIRMQPGVQVNDNGQILIRGNGTNSSATQPMFIVDDIRVEDISTLIPEEVWSVEVIKDATSNIYGGMESANGVIMIETKAKHAMEEMHQEEEKAGRLVKRAARSDDVLFVVNGELRSFDEFNGIPSSKIVSMAVLDDKNDENFKKYTELAKGITQKKIKSFVMVTTE